MLNTKRIFLFIVNPISGNVDKTELMQDILAFATKYAIEIIPYLTVGNPSDENAITALYKKFQPERVIVAGGDGTIKQVAEILQNENAIFGIIPVGSANGLSVDLYLPKRLKDNFYIAFLHNPIAMDMISINGQICLHLSDLGLNAKLVKNYEASSTRGKVGYAMQIMATIKEDELPFTVTINANNKEYKSQARMVVIANSQKYGTGVSINPYGRVNDGVFEIVILKTLDLMTLTKILSGNMAIVEDEIEIIPTTHAKITTNEPTSFQIDGEYHGEQSILHVTLLENKFNVAVP
jgi:YegS/Rv2252/BmrU family lipid kinase